MCGVTTVYMEMSLPPTSSWLTTCMYS